MRAVAALLFLGLAGCVAVKPWQRADHARPAMAAGFGDDGMAGKYRGKVLETKTGGGAARQAPGGGCGCSQ
jgi:hypothetical protein